MIAGFERQLSQTLEEIKSQGLFKTERVITSAQEAHIALTGGKRVLNMCANNYLGLADHPALIAAAKEALDTHGFGMASVRFICGTQDIHKELEAALTKFLGTEDTILYPSCFDANGGLFETLLTEHDAVISDELNHASIIDGIRLCKAQRFRYKHNDMADLEAQLRAAQDARFFFSSRRRHTRFDCDWSSDVCSSDLKFVCSCVSCCGICVARSSFCWITPPRIRGNRSRNFVLDTLVSKSSIFPPTRRTSTPMKASGRWPRENSPIVVPGTSRS